MKTELSITFVLTNIIGFYFKISPPKSYFATTFLFKSVPAKKTGWSWKEYHWIEEEKSNNK